VSLLPCALEGKKARGKLATLYWAWNLADGARRAYRQRICADCFRGWPGPLLAMALGAEDALICPACSAPTVDDMDPVYCTYFLPGMPKGSAEMPMCAKCAVHARAQAMQGADLLEDRGPSSVASATDPTPSADVWASMGLVPR